MKLFTAQWCGPCKMLKQWLSDNNITDIQVVDIDTEEGSKLAGEHGVRGIPALFTGEKLLTTNEVIRPYLLESK